MIELIRSFEGLSFIPVFAGYFCAIFLLYYIFDYFCDNTSFEEASSPELGPYEVLLLKQRQAKVEPFFNHLLFGLWQKQLVSIVTNGTVECTESGQKAAAKGEPGLSEVERSILKLFISTNKPNKVAGDPVLKTLIKQDVIQPARAKLQNERMLKQNEELPFAWVMFLLFFGVAMFPAFIRLWLGIVHQKPSRVLIIVILFGILIGYAILAPKLATSKGRKVLAKLTKNYQWASKKPRNSAPVESLPQGVSPLFIAALFGFGALYTYPEYAAFSHLSVSTGSSGGCSSCSGGSDGGGGGCGGCGGD